MSADREYPQLVADRLRSALDEIELGIVLLDSDLRLTFVNRAFLRIYHLADKSSVSGLDFEGLMRFVVRQRRFLSPARFNAYVKKRANEVRAGIEDPRDIRMDDGQVIRVNCKTLPAGGRMLVYADVTDLVQQGRQAQGNGGGRRHDRGLQPATLPITRRNRVGPISTLSAADVTVNARHRSVQIYQRSFRSRRRRPRYCADRRDVPARETQIRRGGSLRRRGVPAVAAGNAIVGSPRACGAASTAD